MIRYLSVATVLLAFALNGAAQEIPTTGETPDAAPQPAENDSVFSHSQSSRWWISGQINTIYQAHPDFSAKYSGANSLSKQGEAKDSRVMTLYTGLQVTNSTELFFDLESSGGRGIGDALGVAGFTNLDVVRNPSGANAIHSACDAAASHSFE